MKTRNRPGQVKLDDIKLEGGITVKVHLDKNAGTFHALYREHHVQGEDEFTSSRTWDGKDLDKIRAGV